MPLDIATGIAAARHCYELVKGLREALTKPDVNHLEVTNRLMEIQGLIMDAQDALIEAKDEQYSLITKLNNRSEQAEIEKSLTFHSNVYWRGSDGPFCPHCWDNNKKLIRLKDRATYEGEPRGLEFQCPNEPSLLYATQLLPDPNSGLAPPRGAY